MNVFIFFAYFCIKLVANGMKNKATLLLFPLILFPDVVNAQRDVTEFKDYTTTEGTYCSIAGHKRYDPDVYYTKNPDNTYTAHRLTVQPKSETIRVSQPYVYAMRPDRVTIGWKTFSPPEGVEILWGESEDALQWSSTDYHTAKLSDSYHWNHFTLTGLSADKVYYYRLKSNGVTSKTYRIRTTPLDGSEQTMRVLILGDHQRNIYSDYEWMLRMAERKLNEKYGERPIEDNVSFIMNMGDQVDQAALKQYEQIHRFKNRYVMSSLPIQTVVGNHDTYGDTDLNIYNGHYSAYRSVTYKGIDSGTAGYYAYQCGRVLWVCINSDDAGADQKMWIRRVVATADTDPSVDFIVSVQHRPLYAEMYSRDVSDWMLNEVMPILSSSPKHVMNCSGHHHLYARGQMANNPVYHIISGGGVGISEGGYEQLWGVTDVELCDHDHVQATIDQWTYQIVEFEPTTRTMTVESYSVGNKRMAQDNVLVDRFSRTLEATDKPERPSFSPLDKAVELPAVIAQKDAVEGLHSAQYQLSHTASFAKIQHERVITCENLYGVDERLLPLDKNKGMAVTSLPLAENVVPSGVYYLRARNRNHNLDYSEWSEPVQITISNASDKSVGIYLEKSQFAENDELAIHFFNAPSDGKARIAIYRNGVNPSAENMPFAFKYAREKEGVLNFRLTSNGRFYAVMLDGSGYKEISERVHFSVGEETPAMYVRKHVFDEGEPVVLQLNGVPAGKNDWVGIYAQGITPKNTTCPTWSYVGESTNAEIALNAPGTKNYKAPLPAGTYFVNYFLNDGYDELYDRHYFVIGKGCVLFANSTSIAQGESAAFLWEGVPNGVLCHLAKLNAQSGEWETVAELKEIGGIARVDNLSAGKHSLRIQLDGVPVSETCTIQVLPPSGVNAVNTSDSDAPKEIYTLSGQRVQGEDLTSGIYLINGRKVLK